MLMVVLRHSNLVGTSYCASLKETCLSWLYFKYLEEELVLYIAEFIIVSYQQHGSLAMTSCRFFCHWRKPL